MKWLARLLGYWLYRFGCGGSWFLDLTVQQKLICTVDVLDCMRQTLPRGPSFKVARVKGKVRV